MVTDHPSRAESASSTVEPSPADAGSDDPPDPATISDLLAERRRRYALYYLLGCDYAASVAELTEQVAVWETETRPDDVDPAVFEHVQVSLRRHHLPILVDGGAVEYDEDGDLVMLADDTDRLRVALYAAAEREGHDR